MTKKKVAKKRGRPEKPLKIDGDWKDAVKHALKRGKPPTPKRVSGGVIPEKRDAERKLIEYARLTE